MGEIDSIFIIKQTYSLLYIFQDFLKEKKIYNAESLEQALKRGGLRQKKESEIRIQDCLKHAFIMAESPYAKRMEKFRQRDNLVSQVFLEKKERFEKIIPIFVSGTSVSEYNPYKETGIDPYSLGHMFTTNFLEAINEGLFSEEVLNKIILFYLHPDKYIQETRKQDEEYIIKDILSEEIKDLNIKGVGYGALFKTRHDTYKTGNSVYNTGLLSEKDALREAQGFDEVWKSIKNIDFEDKELIKQKIKTEVAINQHLMALRFADILDKIQPAIIQTRKKYGFGIPLYMQKNSPSARIMKLAKKYTEKNLPDLFFIGKGILSGTPEKIPLGGISHPTALGKLFGFIDSLNYLDSLKEQEKELKKVKLKKIENTDPIIYEQAENIPWLLCEQNTKNSHPNIEDLTNKILSEQRIKTLTDFMELFKLGISRIEPRIITLMTTNSNINTGFRWKNKENRLWFNELEGKELVTADMIQGFLEMKCITQGKKADIRGSELSHKTTPKIDRKWIRDYEKGIIDAGCTIEKLISTLPRNMQKQILQEQMKKASDETIQDFFMFHDDNFEPVFAKRGTDLHAISSEPMTGLAHYKTLELLNNPKYPFKSNIKPKSSANYCETPFFIELEIEGKKFTASMHPDAYLFLKKGDQEYDIIIIDTKTNPVRPYPEHKYLQQTFFYGWLIKQAMKKELNLEIENIYTVLNKNAFYKSIKNPPKKSPHSTFRKQKYSPITAFFKEDIMFEIMPKIVKKIIDDKEQLKKDTDYFKNYKKECKYCNKCFVSQKIICDWISERLAKGENIKELFSNINNPD
ncbi:hypothetical protein DRJ22_01555 [Candidatus Woesearchaeota archaeon]|nr:MAG: hypothetical protein B6U93_03065 [Candidatus Woesearchaeota archaeon ex4484_78]RLE46577.1 MAG: hypothetical protein DRJ22_01555 [Candidatus Woesearchaeota archaeon]